MLGGDGGRKELDWSHLYWACHAHTLSAVKTYKCRAGPVSLVFIYFIDCLILYLFIILCYVNCFKIFLLFFISFFFRV